jgi:hypothetical protein
MVPIKVGSFFIIYISLIKISNLIKKLEIERNKFVNQFYYQFNLSKQRSNFHFHSLINDIKPYSTFYDTIILLQIQKTFHIFIYCNLNQLDY